MYGLKEASQAWYVKLTEVFERIGLIQSKNDHCLFILKDQESITYILVYVDDILIFYTDERAFQKISSTLKLNFRTKDLGIVKNFLGMSVDFRDNLCLLNQAIMIESVATKFCVVDSMYPIPKTPMEEKLKICIDRDNLVKTKLPFKELLGSLMYIMVASRPDVCYAVSFLSRFQNCATNEIFFHYLLCVLKYLYHTRFTNLVFSGLSDIVLEGYADADYGNDVND